MDYKKKYEEAIERLKQWDREHPNGYAVSDRDEFIFPELRENKNEKVKKSLIRLVKSFYDVNFPTPEGFTKEQLLSWLEKQGEQKPQGKSALEAAKEEKYEVPSVSKTEDISVTSRMAMIDDDLKPIAEFILDYAGWNLHKDEWNHPVLEVPLFRVLDALIQRGKPYCGKN